MLVNLAVFVNKCVFVRVMCIMSCRNPWAYLIANKLKAIENRTRSCPENVLGEWCALHVSTHFSGREEEMYFVKECVSKHAEFFDGRALWEIQEDMRDQCGHIIAFLKITSCCASKTQAQAVDPIYTDYPKRAKSWWRLSTVISLRQDDWIEMKGQVQVVHSNSFAQKSLFPMPCR
jgi:hypothetical protein